MRTQQRRPQDNGRKRTATRRKPQDTRRTEKLIQSQNPDAKIRKRGNVYFLFQNERRRGLPWQLAATIILAFALGIGSAISYATISNMNRQISVSQDRLSRQREENLALGIATTERYTRYEISHRARALGLREPDPSQIIYFYAPAQSGVFIRHTPAHEQENYFWRGVMAFIRDALARII